MEATNGGADALKSLPRRLKGVLQEIHGEQCSHVPNPSGCKKRASVALVIRIRPSFAQLATYDQEKCSSSINEFQESLDNFYSQDWVRHGDPEVLFIKRAARVGDRWTSHIALPGGKRDPEDSEDRATSIRETREETGLELDIDHCLYIGNLPERIIRTAWDQTPLMVLCPYVYLMMRHDLPPLALQPSEIHSTHWVPMRGLLTPALRRPVYTDATDRFTRQRQPFIRLLIRAIAGQMLFGAVKLKPTESLYCSSRPNYIRAENESISLSSFVTEVLRTGSMGVQSDEDDQPLLLWGLTLGILADLLELIDMSGTSKLWSWPTFSPWDMRFLIWLMTYKFRSRKLRDLTRSTGRPGSEGRNGVTIGGFDGTTFTTSQARNSEASAAGVAAMHLLDGYSDQLQRAVIVALSLRFAVGTTLTAFLVRKYRRSRL